MFDIRLDEVIPLLDAIGPEGTFIITRAADNQDEAEQLLAQVAKYRTSA